MLLDQKMVVSISLLSHTGLLLAAIAEAYGRVPVLPLFHTFPIAADGVTAGAWKLAFIGILSGFIVPCLVLAAVMFRRWYEREDKFRQMAVRDGLTGLFNRRYFLEQFEAEFDRSRRHGHPLSFLILDVDHFKRINDGHGHQAGDRVCWRWRGLWSGQSVTAISSPGAAARSLLSCCRRPGRRGLTRSANAAGGRSRN